MRLHKKSIWMIVLLTMGASLLFGGTSFYPAKANLGLKKYTSIAKIEKARSFSFVALTRKIKPKGTEVFLPQINMCHHVLVACYVKFILIDKGNAPPLRVDGLPLKRGPPSY